MSTYIMSFHVTCKYHCRHTLQMYFIEQVWKLHGYLHTGICLSKIFSGVIQTKLHFKSKLIKDYNFTNPLVGNGRNINGWLAKTVTRLMTTNLIWSQMIQFYSSCFTIKIFLSSTASYIEKKEVYADMSSKVMSTRMLYIFLACMFKNIHSNVANNYQFFCYGNLIHKLKKLGADNLKYLWNVCSNRWVGVVVEGSKSLVRYLAATGELIGYFVLNSVKLSKYI